MRLLAELKRRNVIRMAADVSPSASVVSQAAKWMDHLTQELAP